MGETVSIYCNSNETLSGAPCQNRVASGRTRCKDGHYVRGGNPVLREVAPGITGLMATATRGTLDAEDIQAARPATIMVDQDLIGRDFSGEMLNDADFRNSDLTGASFRDAVLTKADMRGSQLSGADFSDAILEKADLRGANLEGADLTGADLTSIRYNAKTQFTGALFDGGTVLPRGATVFDLGLSPNHHDLDRFSFGYR